MYNTHTRIHAFIHGSHSRTMKVLFFGRILVDLFTFNCLSFSLELCVYVRACVRAFVRACVRACVCVCVFFSPNTVEFCYVYELVLLMTT